MRRKTLFSAVLLSCLFPGTLPASPLQDGMNAFSVGDYEKAEKILRPIEKEQPSAAYLLRMIDVLNKDAKVRKNSKDIFLREVVSNGCDAITKLKKLEMMGLSLASDDSGSNN